MFHRLSCGLTNLAIVRRRHLRGEIWLSKNATGGTYIGGRQAKKPSKREWFELHCCGSSQEWA